MFELFTALLIIGSFFVYWRNFIYQENYDIIFLIVGLSFIASAGMFFENVWLIRMRHIILPSFVIWSLFYFFQKKPYVNRLSYNFIFLFILILVACIWSEYPVLSFKLKIKNILYPVLFLIAGTYIADYDKFKRFVRALFFPALFTILTIVLSNKGVSSDYRLNIHNINSNGTAGYLGASILLVLNMWYISCWKYKIPILILLFTAMIPLFMTGSRTGILSTLFASTVVLVPFIKNLGSLVLMVITLGIGGAGFIFYIWNTLAEQVKTRVFDISNMSGRSNFWQVSFDAVAESPWFGIGTMYYSNSLGDIAWGSMLNIYFNIYVELGIIGSIIAGIFFIQLLYYMFWCYKNINNSVKYFIFAVLIFALTNGVGESMSMRGSHPITLIFLTFIGVLSNMKNNKDFFKQDIINNKATQ